VHFDKEQGDGKVHETLHNVHVSPDNVTVIKSRRMGWVLNVPCMDDMANACRILVGNSQGKIPVGGPRRRWEDNVKMDLKGIGCKDVDWVQLAEYRVQWWALGNTLISLRAP
jgi:hypothetical protein